MKRVHVRIEGKVQGVFFREAARKTAEGLHLSGWIANEPDGTVEAEVEGPPQAVEEWVRWCHRGPPAARVDHVVEADRHPEFKGGGFEVRR